MKRAPRIVHRASCGPVCCDQDCDGRGLGTQEEWDAHEHLYPARLPAPAAHPETTPTVWHEEEP